MTDAVNPARILLVEDSEADADLVKFCLKKNKLHTHLVVYDNGTDALDYILKRNGYENAETPDIILLDINLPGVSGIDILKQIKENESTKIIPTVMLTSSKQDEDILKSYSFHANCFMQKPLDLSSFQKIIDTFESFWFSIVKLPTHVKH